MLVGRDRNCENGFRDGAVVNHFVLRDFLVVDGEDLNRV